MVGGAVKVFKKASPNGKVTAYLTQRDFVDNNGKTAPVTGVLVVDDEYLKGRKVFARVAVTYRYGREDDEMMGMSFVKEFILTNDPVGPGTKDAASANETQKRLMEKLGANAHPFQVKLPDSAPASVTLDGGDEGGADLGVVYELRFYADASKQDNPDKKASIPFATRKVQYAKLDPTRKMPSIQVNKGFTLSKGKLICDISLNKDTYYHGEDVVATVNIDNQSKKTVKLINVHVIQHVEITMNSNMFTRQVAGQESKEGCPVTPGQKLEKKYPINISLQTQKKKTGIAMDGPTKDKDANLASSTLTAAGSNPDDSLGIIVAYSLRVKLDCGKIAGQLTGDLPFKLVYPDPSAEKGEIAISDFKSLRRGQSVRDD